MSETLLEDEHEWCRTFLSHSSKYPFNGSYSIGELGKLYTEWRSADWRIGGEDAAEHHAYETMLNKNAFGDRTYHLGAFEYKSSHYHREHRILASLRNQPEPSDYGEYNHREWPPKINRILVRGALESDNSIVAEGTKRGRKYRHKLTRPLMEDSIVAGIMESILEKSTKTELSMEEIRRTTIPIIKAIHTICEEDIFESAGGLEVVREDIELQYSDEVFSDQITGDYVVASFPPGCLDEGGVLWKYKYNFESNLEDWVDLCYDEKWFKGSIANIQRILKISGLAVSGSKRGLWVHKGRLRKIATKTGPRESTSSKVGRVEEEIRKGIKMNMDDIPFLSMLRITLEEQMSFIDKLLQRDSDLSQMESELRGMFEYYEEVNRLLENEDYIPEDKVKELERFNDYMNDLAAKKGIFTRVRAKVKENLTTKDDSPIFVTDKNTDD